MAIENLKPSYPPAGIAVARVNFGVRDKRGSVPRVVQPLSAAARAILTKIAAGLHNELPERPVSCFTLEDLGKAANIGAKQAGYIVEALEHPTTLDSWGGDLVIYPRVGDYRWAGYIRTVQRYRKPMQIFLHPDFYRGELKDFLAQQHLSPWPAGPWPQEPRPRIYRGTRVARRQDAAQSSVPKNQPTGATAKVYTEVLTELKTEVLTEVCEFSTEILTEVSTELMTEVTSVHQEESTNSLSPQGSVVRAAVTSVLKICASSTAWEVTECGPRVGSSSSQACAIALSGEAGMGVAPPPAGGGGCVLRLEPIHTAHGSSNAVFTDHTTTANPKPPTLDAEESNIPSQTGKVAGATKESRGKQLETFKQHQSENLEPIKVSTNETSLSDSVNRDITRLIESLRDFGGVTRLQPIFADRIRLEDGGSEDRAMRWPDSSGVDQSYSRHVKLQTFEVNGRTIQKNTVPTCCTPDEFLKNEISKIPSILSRDVQLFKKRGGKEKITNLHSLGTHIYIMGIEGAHHDKNALKYFVLDDVTPSRFHKLFRDEGYFKHLFIQTSSNKFQMIVFTNTWLSIDRRKEIQKFFATLNVPENEPPFSDPDAVSGERFFRLPGARNRKPGRENFEARIYDYKTDLDTPPFDCGPTFLATAKYYLEGSLYEQSQKYEANSDQQQEPPKARSLAEEFKVRLIDRPIGKGNDQSPSGLIFRQACKDVRAVCNKTSFRAQDAELYSTAVESIVKSSMQITGKDRPPKTIEYEAKKIVEVFVPKWKMDWINQGRKRSSSGKTINQYLRSRPST